MLQLEDLTVSVNGKVLIKDFSLHIEKGEVHVIFGPNGVGKSTIVYAILGFPGYKIVKGRIIFKDKDITNIPTYERVKMGIGVAFQHPPKIKGLKLVDMVNICANKIGEEVDENILRLVDELKIPRVFLQRDFNVGFSGGEIKKNEILQLVIQNPDFIILDEPDSGVDIENIGLIGGIISKLLERNLIPSLRRKAGLLITHSGHILRFVKVDRAHVLLNGRKACSGEPEEILKNIMERGYEECVKKCQIEES
ncbi:MAG: ABC transporter ATP-binding protein [Candidatus Bathyarchaeota archaeon]